jgi:hypothetical protein
MRLDVVCTHQDVANSGDVAFREGFWLAIESDQLHHAGNLQDLKAVPQREMDKHVAGKERQLESYAAVSPFAHRFVARQEMVYSMIDKLICHSFLAVRAGVNSIPTGLEETGQLLVPGLYRSQTSHRGRSTIDVLFIAFRKLRSVAHRAKRDLITYSS